MLEKDHSRGNGFEFVNLEDLVPQKHLLRTIDERLSFGFVRERMAPFYCLDNGRPALDPVILFKMLFIGYLYGIRSERQLVRDIEVNLAYRWFLGLSITDPVPHHSTISQNRRRRFRESNIFQEIFDDVVFQAMEKGFVEGRTLYTDSTHLKANANRERHERVEVKEDTRKYLADLEEAITSDREAHGKGPLKKDAKPKEKREIRRSKTDPDSGYMARPDKPRGFYYLDHRTVDGRCNIITDVHITPGNVYDSIPYLERLDRQRRQFGFKVKHVGLDAGYHTADICHGLEERKITGVIGYRRAVGKKGFLRKKDFRWDAPEDCYWCIAGEKLPYRTTNRHGFREYGSAPEVCKACVHRHRCTQSRNCQKVITRHVWEEDKERVRENRLSPAGKAIYARRKETIERSFADAKQLHGYRYARFRGIASVREQCLMTAICQNIKKMARTGRKSIPKTLISIPRVFCALVWLYGPHTKQGQFQIA